MASEAIDPRSALDETAAAREVLSRRLASPLWFHVGLGLLVAQQALVAGLVGGGWTIVSFLVLLGGSAALVLLARRATGITVATPRGPRSSGLMALRVLAALGCIWGAERVGSQAFVGILALTALVTTVLLGVGYDRALRLDLLERGSHA